MAKEKSTPAEPTPKAPKQGPEMPAYLIKFPTHGLNGRKRIVTFYNGHGVLDRWALAISHRDLCDRATLVCAPGVGPEFFHEAAKYFEGLGAKIEKVPESVAAAYRDRLQANPSGHVPKPKPEAKPERFTGKSNPKASGKATPITTPPPHKRGKE